jgi:hypothetical protein
MKYKLNPLIHILIFIFFVSAARADESTNRYQINRPDRNILNQIEQAGGIVERYIPGEFAEVLLSKQVFIRIKDQGYKIYIIDPEIQLINLLDSLSNDHIIGSSYHNYEAVTYILDSLQTLYPDICRVISIGKTVENREMWTICITDNPEIEEVEPEVKFVANMHGDELITQEMMLIFIEYILENYESDSRIQQLIDNTEIWILPNMNFDGSQKIQRRNANNIDLNRNFPDRDPRYINPDTLQIETINLINWSQNHNFVLSANFHSGALVVNYPWDYNLNGSSEYSATPDDETFIRLSLAYAKNNSDMYSSEHFTNGITNGAEWYQVIGGMMDWNYQFLSCMDLTIELSEDKMPQVDSLAYFWSKNCVSMLTLLEQVNSGVQGNVKDSLTNKPLLAEVKVSEIGKTVYTDPDSGDYYRLLEPGFYQFLFEAEGYYPQLINNVIVDSGSVTHLDIMMKPVIYYTLSGTVTDTVSQENLAGVKLFFYQNELLKDSTITDASGDYSKTLPVGKYRIVTKITDYFDKELRLNLFDNINLDIELLKIIPGFLCGSVSTMDGAETDGSIVFCQMKSDTIFSGNYFEINGLIPGDIKIFAAKFGYKTTSIDTFLENGGSLDLTEIQLWPGSNDYFTNFESMSIDFNGSGDWQLDNISFGPDGAYSGNFAWATNPQGNYSSGLLIHSLETNVFSLNGMAIPVLEIYHWFSIETGYDGANVKASDEYGRNWQILRPNPDYPVEALTNEFNNPMAGEPVYSGNSDSWYKISFNLSKYKKWPFIKFRFDLGVDQQKTAAGWYLDDFKIFDANATEILTNSYQLNDQTLDVDIYPNPANPTTTFSILTNYATEVDITIFNISGQLIKKVSLNSPGNQQIKWQWRGDNFLNKTVASGIYFARVENPHKNIIRKIILVH